MGLRTLVNWLWDRLGKPTQKPEIVVETRGDNEWSKYMEQEKREEYPFDRFKRWIREQNEEHTFAKEIRDGTTVYFSDDFAAAYDLRIRGMEEENPFIIVQLDIGKGKRGGGGIDYRFLETAVKTWSTMRAEIWYLDPKVKWIIVINKEGRREYGLEEMIISSKIDFQFKLSDIV